MASLPKPVLTFDEYIELENQRGAKFEYYAGEVFALPPSSPAHSRIETNLIEAVAPLLAGSDCRVYASSLRIFLEESGLYTYADLSIVCGPLRLERGPSATNPKIVFEILAPPTRRDDSIGKSELYRQVSSIEEFILIEQEGYSIERLRRLPDDQWELTRFQGEDAVLELSSINVSIPFEQIYADVPFELAEREPELPWRLLR